MLVEFDDHGTFTPVSGFLGGVLIGLAAVLLLFANRRIAGVIGAIYERRPR